MSTDGNIHARNAQGRTDRSWSKEDELIEAVLAVAYELHTQNLLQLAALRASASGNAALSALGKIQLERLQPWVDGADKS